MSKDKQRREPRKPKKSQQLAAASKTAAARTAVRPGQPVTQQVSKNT
jgi:hypothetical protein